MKNYQLYSTNILLGGQMKWDLILSPNNNSLDVSDFHLKPIHPSLYKNIYSENISLKYTHEENLTNFYKYNLGNFFEVITEPEYTHDWPINEEYKIINPYIMGCYRAKKYSEYNKQFEFFCPIWLEKLGPDDCLSFNFIIKNINGHKLINKSLDLNLKNHTQYHNEFVNYFNSYLQNIHISEGNDDVINIDIKNNKATLSGINLLNGQVQTYDISELIHNITYRERPIMELDNMLINNFKNNKFITKQLFNFNLCFNIEDIIPNYMLNEMLSKNIIVYVDVYINNEKLNKKDFYTNYDYLPKKNITNQFINTNHEKYNQSNNENVLSYLNDNNYISLINKNKFYPNIIHWSLNGNNDYIFNLYDGFSSYYIDDNDSPVYNNVYYMDTPNIDAKEYSKIYNNTNWINTYIVKSYEDFKNVIADYIKKSDEYANHFQKGHNWVNNLLYDVDDDIDIYVMNIYYEGDEDNWNSIKKICNEIEDNLYFWESGKYIYIITNDLNQLLFNKIKNISSDNTNFQNIQKILKKLVEPNLISFDKSLYIEYADGPDLKCSEIEYYKNNSADSCVIRYDGKIIPTFVDSNNYLYYKDIYNSDRKKYYDKYMNSGYTPIYKSINYYSILKDDLNYHKNDKLVNEIEYKWYEDNKLIIIKSEIETEYDSDIKSLEDVVKDFINKYYKLNVEKTKKYDLLNYIYDLYNDEIYMLNIVDKNKYKYYIKLTLK